MCPSEKLADFVEKTINQHLLKNEQVCKANHTLDWLMQKSWSKSLTYTSYPDETVHTVKEGLWSVFELIQDLDESLRIIMSLYNNELYRLYELLENAPRAEELKELQTLKKIKELLA